MSYVLRDDRPGRECQRSDFNALELIKTGTHCVGDELNHQQAGRTFKWRPQETNIQHFIRQQRNGSEEGRREGGWNKQDKGISPTHIKTELSVAPSRCPKKCQSVCK